MEKKMETTIVCWDYRAYIGATLGLYRGHIGFRVWV